MKMTSSSPLKADDTIASIRAAPPLPPPPPAPLLVGGWGCEGVGGGRSFIGPLRTWINIRHL